MDTRKWCVLVKECKDITEKLKFSASDEVSFEEIGDGNLNEVGRVYTADGRSIIVKHSLPYMKCLGQGYPLAEQRIDIEYKALQKFHLLSPGSVPEPYTFNKPENAVYMEDLVGYQVLRGLLMDGKLDMNSIVNVARHLAVIHQETHVGKIGADAVNELDQYFDNAAMVTLTQQFVFTRPFAKNDETNKCSTAVSEILDSVYGDDKVLSAAKDMLEIFLHKKECLIHGDFHTGSILVKGTDARMFDIEFAIVGPAAFDLGLLVANFIFSYYRHMSIEENNDVHRTFAYKVIDASKTFMNTYLEHMVTCTGSRDIYEASLISQTAGFAGCEIIRRLIGAAHNADLDGLPLAEQDCLGAGIRLLQAWQRIHDIDRLLVIALMLV